MQTAENVARWFLNRNDVKVILGEADYISNLKLQKLLYYAQGINLALYDEPLFADEIVAWEYGPVVRDVYQAYCHNGADGIKVFCEPAENFSERDEGVLQFTYKAFGQFSAWKLVDMTHNEMPWKATPKNATITHDKIKKFFTENYVE